MRSIGAGWMRSRPLRFLAIAIIGLVLGAGGCSQLVEKERELTFRVVQGNASWYGGLPAGVEELDIPLHGAGQHINAWWWPSDRAHAPAVLYFHGSRWNLTGQLTRISQLHEFGFSVLAIDYRGFGKSAGGVPSEESVYEDARVAWNRFTELVPDANRRFIYGHSLGGAVAVDLAAALDRAPAHAGEEARGLIVESSFTTLVDVAKAVSYSWLPLQWILSQKFDTLGKISEVKMPVLFVHGADDRFVPARFSQALYDATHAPKKLLLVEGATHNNSMRIGSDEYRAALRALFRLPDDRAPVARAPRGRKAS
ncbi:MAG: alpha/beta hydrolase [Betaproteobacteria bacterium]|nr:alpha/beta hydrolase [Casimicrobiaceae bacterium]